MAVDMLTKCMHSDVPPFLRQVKNFRNLKFYVLNFLTDVDHGGVLIADWSDTLNDWETYKIGNL